MNPLHRDLETGTLGELLVQLRLLQYDVQAAPPLKDTGNDLIAVRGDVMKAIQVKTTRGERPSAELPNRSYHLQALVRLVGEDRQLRLDDCEVFLVPVEDIEGLPNRAELREYTLDMNLIERLFPRR